MRLSFATVAALLSASAVQAVSMDTPTAIPLPDLPESYSFVMEGWEQVIQNIGDASDLLVQVKDKDAITKPDDVEASKEYITDLQAVMNILSDVMRKTAKMAESSAVIDHGSPEDSKALSKALSEILDETREQLEDIADLFINEVEEMIKSKEAKVASLHHGQALERRAAPTDDPPSRDLLLEKIKQILDKFGKPSPGGNPFTYVRDLLEWCESAGAARNSTPRSLFSPPSWAGYVTTPEKWQSIRSCQDSFNSWRSSKGGRDAKPFVRRAALAEALQADVAVAVQDGDYGGALFRMLEAIGKLVVGIVDSVGQNKAARAQHEAERAKYEAERAKYEAEKNGVDEAAEVQGWWDDNQN